ncbi:SRPBCC family protein [Falsigemmobacter faecalis]|uniref:SRPBCC family protein n=1 Tax=Falsigemmobacter faecalis TaxID=2488730 RepID=A0A3P3DDB8_9RHOB|nr:SRPBCC family protein [Falsigemmobacter faecalis]RRH72315.1 SRPBCC family protein [Falsigemmobacter faecalis]
MFARFAAGFVLAIGLAAPALAHGPARLKTEQSVVLDAPVAEVWSVVGNFSDPSWDPSTESFTQAKNEKGATRERVLKTGGAVTEELMRLDPAKHAISVRFVSDNIAAVKASNYAAHITLKEEGGKTRVDWRGAFYRAFPQNDPPADLNDEASTEAVRAHHQAGLDALAARFGKVN